MKKIKTILILISGLTTIISSAQTPVVMTDSAYVYSTTGHSNLVIVDDDVPILLTFSRNTITCQNSSGLILFAGRDLPDEDVNNVDNAIISGNWIDWNGTIGSAHGIMAGYNINFDIRHNKIDKAPYGIVIEGTQGMTYTKGGVSYNIFTGSQYYGVTNEGQSNLPIYNNTFYNGYSNISGYVLHIGYNNEVTPTAYTHNAKIKNNIFYSRKDPDFIFVDSEAALTLECDYNLYYVEDGDHKPRFYIGGRGELTFEQWQALGFDIHSIVIDPDFIDTINFVPSKPLFYGTDLGEEFDAGLDPSYKFVAKQYPATTRQGVSWQVGAITYKSETTHEADYYVAPWGNDSNAGTFDNPWRTPQKAFETAKAGDIVYFRGGRYYPTVYEYGSDVYHYDPEGGRGYSGTAGNRIYYMNYPGEMPIFDFSEITPAGIFNVGLYMENVHYVTYKGMKWVNLSKTPSEGPNVHMIDAIACSNITFDQIVIDSCGGAGIRYFSGIGDDMGIATDTTYFINCDLFRCVNTGGEHADGIKYDQDAGAYVVFDGCRFMFNSDDGLDASGSATRIIKNCWAFGTGWETEGNGNGFKIGALRDTLDNSSIVFFNNLAAYNHNPTTNSGAGLYIPDYQVSDTSYRRANARVYNNTMYKNDIGFFEVNNPLWKYRNCQYRNNIAYASMYELDGHDINVNITTYYYPESHNTWDWESGGYSFVETDTVTVTDADFMLTDSTLAVGELMAERKTDGSLPDITFMRLAAGSDLIDAGTTYGWDELKSYPGIGEQVFQGSAPDIGYSEYNSGTTTPANPTYLSSTIENITPSRLDMTYNLTLANIVPSTSAFSVRVNNVARTVTAVTISGSKVLLTLANPVVYGDAVTVAYTKPASNPLQTAAGGQAASLSTQNVVNKVAAIPVYISAVVENATPARLELTYNLTLANILPSTSAFSVRVNNVARTVTAVAISGSKVLLTLASPVVYGDALTVAYTKPSSNPLQTAAGGQAASISAQSVINNCSVVPNSPPLITIISPTKNFAFVAPATITIEATASDPDGSINRVEFYSGTTKIGEILSEPFTFIWKDVPAGSYSLTAVATDNLNAKSVSAIINIVVEKSTGSINQLPVVSISINSKSKKPRRNDKVVIIAEAYDPDGTISRVELKSGTVTIAELTVAPYEYLWVIPDTGSYSFTALAIDDLGAIGSSAKVELRVEDFYDAYSGTLELYPNPNNGRFKITMNSMLIGDNGKISVVGLSGKVIYQESLDEMEIEREIDLSDAAAGTYVIIITSGNEIINAKKFLKL